MTRPAGMGPAFASWPDGVRSKPLADHGASYWRGTKKVPCGSVAVPPPESGDEAIAEAYPHLADEFSGCAAAGEQRPGRGVRRRVGDGRVQRLLGCRSVETVIPS